MQLRPGDVVLDVGCGAGNAFPALREAVGDSGRIVGIDISPTMLTRAQARIDANGWTNVEIRLTDASTSTISNPGNGDLAPHGERSWPPVAAGLATKTTKIG